MKMVFLCQSQLTKVCGLRYDPQVVAQSGKIGGKRTSGGDDDQPAKKPRKTKPYVPTLRSGPYALMLGLGTQDEGALQGMTKAQLIEVAQPFCDSSFTSPPDPTKFYTAWNSMKTLIQKDLVYEHGRPLRKYLLSEEGWEVVKRLQKTLPGAAQNTSTSGTTTETQQTITSADRDLPEEEEEDPSAKAEESLTNEDIANIEPVMLPPKSFTIQLVLDTREVRTSTDRDYISGELMKQGITPQVRALEVGDAMWVAKCNDPNLLTRHGEECDEVMLDWIVERKRLDDLIGSIKDGRFHEQKFRLRRSGIKNVIYLIEEFNVTHPDSTSGSAAQYQEMVASAIASTQVLNEYFIKKTKHLDESIRYLARMTLLLRKMYGVEDSPSSPDAANNINLNSGAPTPISRIGLIPGRRLSTDSYLIILDNLRSRDPSITYGVSFTAFSALTSKSDILTLRDVFLKMLMCTRGVTGEKALEIQQIWPTPRHLMEAYMALEPKERESMVATRMAEVVGRKKVAKELSKRIAEIWGESS